MTIATRRRVYWALLVSAALCLGASVYLALPAFRGIASFGTDPQALRPLSFLGARLFSHQVAAVGVIAAALGGTLILAFVVASFRKTVSSEIFFFSLFALSLGLEGGRLLVLKLATEGAPHTWIMTASRLVLVGRAVGDFAMFASGLYAAGFRNEKLGSVAAAILITAVTFGTAMPLDTGVYEPNLLVRPGYARLMVGLSFVFGLVTVANFLYAAANSGEGTYRYVALGAALLLAGHALLTAAWTPLPLLAGMALLGLGSWLFVSRLHAYYLWQ